MKFGFFTFIFLTLPLAQAAQQFTIEGRQVQFIDDVKKRLTVNSKCKTSDFDSCLALKAAKKVSLRTLPGNMNGANPGAELCFQLKAKVIKGYDKKRNENSFCQFKDGSIIDNGSLHYYARTNDKATDVRKKSPHRKSKKPRPGQ